MMAIFVMMLALATDPGTTKSAPPAPDKMICKRILDTGSLVKGKKDCRTKQEWEKLAWGARLGTESFQGNNMGRPPGE